MEAFDESLLISYLSSAPEASGVLLSYLFYLMYVCAYIRAQPPQISH